MSRREYNFEAITVNRIKITKVIIDPHYEESHADHISDEIILELVRELDDRIELPEASEGGFQYFATLLELNKKQYRLVWLLEGEAIHIGVLNAYRDDRKE